MTTFTQVTDDIVLRSRNRARYLKLIALFKIVKGVLLLAIGFSLLVLNNRTRWLDAISDCRTRF